MNNQREMEVKSEDLNFLIEGQKLRVVYIVENDSFCAPYGSTVACYVGSDYMTIEEIYLVKKDESEKRIFIDEESEQYKELQEFCDAEFERKKEECFDY